MDCSDICCTLSNTSVVLHGNRSEEIVYCNTGTRRVELCINRTKNMHCLFFAYILFVGIVLFWIYNLVYTLDILCIKAW